MAFAPKPLPWPDGGKPGAYPAKVLVPFLVVWNPINIPPPWFMSDPSPEPPWLPPIEEQPDASLGDAACVGGPDWPTQPELAPVKNYLATALDFLGEKFPIKHCYRGPYTSWKFLAGLKP